MLEQNLSRLLSGQAIEENEDLCDFTLADQNEAFVAKGIVPSTPSDYTPVINKTVTYIVMAVIINNEGDVLMIQEAKSSCAGQWYLPAGRIDPGENIEDAVKREVLEETGLEMEPTTLLMVECASKGWFRFVMTGLIVGGRLKTPADADAESLQAKWINDLGEVNLRGNDINPIIEHARTYYSQKQLEKPWHGPLLPAVSVSHRKLLLRLVVCSVQKSSNDVHVLLSEKTEAHFPFCEINHNRNLHSVLRKFMMEIFGADLPPHKPHGILNVEHCSQPGDSTDGFCITVLVSFKVPVEGIFPIDKYSWVVVGKEIGKALLERIPKNMTVPLHVIR
ncbi:unnamed protein product [Bemisia tabaci]|uniref:Nudix hydrolase domain-containing protein n=1 Tax=Bemisia tabaci TaxID=7038 RepID=A0A9P0F3G2_BEMTA|nr:unnamed protein product [Bemisia tabaci]